MGFTSSAGTRGVVPRSLVFPPGSERRRQTRAVGPYPHVVTSGWQVHRPGWLPVPACAREAALQMPQALILESWPSSHPGFATEQ